MRLAFTGFEQAGQHLHGRGFAAAVGAEEAEDFAAPDFEADIVDGCEAAETASQSFGFDGDALVIQLKGWNLQGLVGFPFGLGEQADEGGIQLQSACAVKQLLRAAGRQHLAGVHRYQPVEPHGLVHIGGGDQYTHAGPLMADALDQLPELAAGKRVHPGGRFIQNQQVGVMDQGTAEPKFLLHATGQLASRSIAKGSQAGTVQQIVNACRANAPVLIKQPGKKVDVLRHRQGHVQVAPQSLGHVGDTRAHLAAKARLLKVALEQADSARLDLAHTGQQAEQGGLADAVRPDQADHAAGRQCQGGGFQRGHVAIAVADTIQVGHSVRHGHLLNVRRQWSGRQAVSAIPASGPEDPGADS